jgi:DeoR family glycerol-3-phosphate regulon repressor
MRIRKRQSEILAAAKLNGACSIVELAKQLKVSDETIRRNIKLLISEGLIEKVHGGIVLSDHQQSEPPFERRMNKNTQEKKLISSLAADIIKDGDSIMLDTGTTTSYVARALVNHNNLSVVTNCTEIARTLARSRTNRVHLCGGALRPDDYATFGPSAINYVSQFKVDYAILSIGAITEAGEFMDYHLEEAEFSRALIQQARKTIVVVDHSKFGNHNFVKVCDPQKIDIVVTDQQPPHHFMVGFNDADVTVVTPPLL